MFYRYPHCGASDNSEMSNEIKTSIVKKVLLAALVVLFVSSVVLNCVQANELSDIKSEILELSATVQERNGEIHTLNNGLTNLKTQIERLEEKNATLQDAFDFYNNYAAVVASKAGEKYHHYDCHYVRGRTFYIYNVELARYKGYEPCSYCWE